MPCRNSKRVPTDRGGGSKPDTKPVEKTGTKVDVKEMEEPKKKAGCCG
jgi:hypothetical protein